MLLQISNTFLILVDLKLSILCCRFDHFWLSFICNLEVSFYKLHIKTWWSCSVEYLQLHLSWLWSVSIQPDTNNAPFHMIHCICKDWIENYHHFRLNLDRFCMDFYLIIPVARIYGRVRWSRLDFGAWVRLFYIYHRSIRWRSSQFDLVSGSFLDLNRINGT